MGTQNVVVIGNRDISRSIISALTAYSSENPQPRYRVSVVTYPSQTPYLPPSTPARTVEHRTSDFTVASLQRAFSEQDVVISAVSGGYEVQTRIVDAVLAAGVRRFIPNEFGYDTLNSQVQSRISAGVERAKLLEYLQAQQSLEWVAIAAGCVLDPLLLSGDLGFDMEWQSATINGSGEETFAASSLERVGTVVRCVIEYWEAVKNRFIYAAGIMISGNELVASLEKSSNSQWSVGYSDAEDCVREGHSRIERGFPDAGMFLLERSVLYDESLHAFEAFQRRSSNKTLGLDSETTDEIVAKVYHDFKHRGKPSCGCG